MKRIQHIAQRSITVTALFMLLFIPFTLFSQTDTTAAAPAEEAKEEEPSLISPSIEFSSVQKSDNTISLKAILKAKINGQLTRLYGMKIIFSAASDSSEKELGSVITDGKGVALISFKAEGLTTDQEGKLHFKANFGGNKSAEPVEEELTVKRALLTIIPVKEDSVLSVQLKLVDLSTGTETSVPETALGVFVKRWFNPLKIGEGTTDENGEATVEVPANLPGDAKGNITLLARLDDSEEYGNLEAAVVQPWGTPVSATIEELPRALWSPHPPLWMLITFIVLMGVVWGHYIVIVYEMFRLRKEQPRQATNE